MNGLSTKRYHILATAVLLGVSALYLGWLAISSQLGFPLDDAWIHQTYARNLVMYRAFVYTPGAPSAGSTAPLWTILLALAYWFGVEPLLWSYLLGILALFLLSIGVVKLGSRLFPDHTDRAAWAGLVVLSEWHLVWAAFSGMETVLYAAGVVWLMERYMAWEIEQRETDAPARRSLQAPFLLGLIGGGLILVRPEGVLLLALLAVAGLLARRRRSLRRTLSIAIDAAAGAALLLIPYLVFNQLYSGSWLPNTFYAKQIEYAALLAQPIWTRLWSVLKPTWVGAQALLVPGAIYALVALWRPHPRCAVHPHLGRYTRLVPVLWWLLTWLIYALRLPVDYQHGRYLMPTIPILALLGVVGTMAWLRPRSPRLLRRVIGRATPWIIALLLTGFLVIGARAFAVDVGFINGEMVAVAHWLNQHTPPDAIIAAHDIGAIGYFSRRPLLDLAGLVTPEIIPLLRDEPRLLEFILDRRADYVVTFPSWYPRMVNDERLRLIYQTGRPLTGEQDGDNIAVYKLER